MRDSVPEMELREAKLKALGIEKAIRGSLAETPNVEVLFHDLKIQELLTSRNE